MQNKYQALFTHLSEQHGLTLLEHELQEIERIVVGAVVADNGNQQPETSRQRFSLH